ncbi:hypothetical protein HK104_005244 [Borealophlyctis nickersoniae]|nr:hypothetical protein HK104_005244 [Borealophlyctis nickersoniae]
MDSQQQQQLQNSPVLPKAPRRTDSIQSLPLSENYSPPATPSQTTTPPDSPSSKTLPQSPTPPQRKSSYIRQTPPVASALNIRKQLSRPLEPDNLSVSDAGTSVDGDEKRFLISPRSPNARPRSALFKRGPDGAFPLFSGYLYKLGRNNRWQWRLFRFDGTILTCLSPSQTTYSKNSPAVIIQPPSTASALYVPTEPPMPLLSNPLLTGMGNDKDASVHVQLPKWSVHLGSVSAIGLVQRAPRKKGEAAPAAGTFNGARNTFLIRTNDGQNYILRAKRKEDLDRWLFVLVRMWKVAIEAKRKEKELEWEAELRNGAASAEYSVNADGSDPFDRYKRHVSFVKPPQESPSTPSTFEIVPTPFYRDVESKDSSTEQPAKSTEQSEKKPPFTPTPKDSNTEQPAKRTEQSEKKPPFTPPPKDSNTEQPAKRTEQSEKKPPFTPPPFDPSDGAWVDDATIERSGVRIIPVVIPADGQTSEVKPARQSAELVKALDKLYKDVRLSPLNIRTNPPGAIAPSAMNPVLRRTPASAPNSVLLLKPQIRFPKRKDSLSAESINFPAPPPIPIPTAPSSPSLSGSGSVASSQQASSPLPYHMAQLAELLGEDPDNFTTPTTLSRKTVNRRTNKRDTINRRKRESIPVIHWPKRSSIPAKRWSVLAQVGTDDVIAEEGSDGGGGKTPSPKVIQPPGTPSPPSSPGPSPPPNEVADAWRQSLARLIEVDGQVLVDIGDHGD